MNLSNIENVLQRINTKYISLDNDEVAENNKLLKNSLENMISIMKSLDGVFKLLFNKVFYGGSYYDDLKVAHPDEFDLDLLMTIPKLCQKTGRSTCDCVQLTRSSEPGYFWLKVDPDHHHVLKQFIRDGFVQTNLVLNWMKSLVTRALNQLSTVNFCGITATSIKWRSESGPALILQIQGNFGNFLIDLAPAFQFNEWPEGYRFNNSGKHDFSIVPDKAVISYKGERFWRASFQEQERALISGKQRLKPALRLLKKMRNSLIHVSISSYALKTIALWDVDSFNWESSLQVTFLRLLRNYKQHLDAGKISYYWQGEGNLLDRVNPETIRNHCNEISRKLFHLEQTEDPLMVAEIILKRGSTEFTQFLDEYRSQRHSFPINRLQSVSVNEEPEANQLQTGSGLGTAALIVGGAAVLGLSIWGALGRNNRE